MSTLFPLVYQCRVWILYYLWKAALLSVTYCTLLIYNLLGQQSPATHCQHSTACDILTPLE